MVTHPMRTATLAMTALLTVATLTPTGAASAAAQTDADPSAGRRSTLELARARLDDARRQATDAAGRLADAETRRAKLSQEIAAAEADIPKLRARADDLRRMVRERAARLYVRAATPALDLVAGTSTVIDAERAAHLTATIGDHEETVAVDLQGTARTLEVRQAQLREQRADLDRSIAEITPLRDTLDKKVDRAAAVYDDVRSALATGATKPDVTTGAGVCPVQGFVVFTDDFGEPRDDGVLHQGIDMPAKEGTPVVAVVDGAFERDVSDTGGNGAWVRGIDEVSYYYAHFSRYEGAPQLFVKAGDVIGYVGSTGVSTGPHLHFEVHPSGGPAVDGFTLLLSLCADETLRPTK